MFQCLGLWHIAGFTQTGEIYRPHLPAHTQRKQVFRPVGPAAEAAVDENQGWCLGVGWRRDGGIST